MPYASLDSALDLFGDRCSNIRQDLYYCDTSFAQAKSRGVRQAVHAGSYVNLAAALEKFVGLSLAAVVSEINLAQVPLRDLRPELFALIQSNHLDALQQLRGLKMWRRRAQLFAPTLHADACELNVEILPVDGRTIRFDHLATIWEVLGLGGGPLPGPTHSLALKDLADTRNELAHGDSDVRTVAGLRSIQATLSIIDKVEEIALNLWQEADAYLSSTGYLR